MDEKMIDKMARDIAGMCEDCKPEDPDSCASYEYSCASPSIYKGAKKMYEKLKEKNLIKE
jgi:hypothetical protein